MEPSCASFVQSESSSDVDYDASDSEAGLLFEEEVEVEEEGCKETIPIGKV